MLSQNFALINFCIVLFFNIMWLIKFKLDGYKEVYNGKGKVPKWLSVCLWLYALWGIYNLFRYLSA